MPKAESTAEEAPAPEQEEAVSSEQSQAADEAAEEVPAGCEVAAEPAKTQESSTSLPSSKRKRTFLAPQPSCEVD